jgi:hypothetical protein
MKYKVNKLIFEKPKRLIKPELEASLREGIPKIEAKLKERVLVIWLLFLRCQVN